MSGKLVTPTSDVSGHHVMPKSPFCLRCKACMHPSIGWSNFGQQSGIMAKFELQYHEIKVLT
jgi:hypothetical protein